MKKHIILALSICILLGINLYAIDTNDPSHLFKVGNDTNGATIDNSGNFECTGSITNQDIETTYGVSAATGVFTGTVSADKVKFSVALDTSTAPSDTGIIAITSDFNVYVSTSTGVYGWVLVGSQS